MIEIKEEDIKVESGEVYRGNNHFIMIDLPTYDEKKAEQLKQQILDNQRDAKKWNEDKRCYFCYHPRLNHPSWLHNSCGCTISAVIGENKTPKEKTCVCTVYGNPDTGLPEYYPIRDGIIDYSDKEMMEKIKNREKKSIYDDLDQGQKLIKLVEERMAKANQANIKTPLTKSNFNQEEFTIEKTLQDLLEQSKYRKHGTIESPEPEQSKGKKE